MINGKERNIGNNRWADREIDIRRYYDEGEKEVQKFICSRFGCGKILSPAEQLFGDRCQQHQKKETTLSIIDKHLSH